MVRDLMLETIEKRFGTTQAPHAIEWLSDNGSPYTEKETLDFAAALGLVPCFTPVTAWFDDYNESHPHLVLGMISPRDFIRAQAR